MRKIILTLVVLIFSVNLFAQDDIIRLIINGKTIGQVPITENPAIISVNKLSYKKISDLTLIIKQKVVNKIYKRTLQITDKKDSLLFSVNEQRTKAGLYKIDLTKMRQQLLQQDIIKVYLAEDPANAMMRIPSKRQLLTELHLR